MIDCVGLMIHHHTWRRQEQAHVWTAYVIQDKSAQISKTISVTMDQLIFDTGPETGNNRNSVVTSALKSGIREHDAFR